MNGSRSEHERAELHAYFRRKYRPQRRLSRGLVDAAPLVDVVLLLLLFFIINSSFVLQPGIGVDLPVSGFEEGESYSAMVVTVAQEGMVFFNDERTTLEGLASAFSQAAHEDPGTGLIIEADARVQQGDIVRIYNMAMDAGITRATLATRLPPTSGPTP